VGEVFGGEEEFGFGGEAPPPVLEERKNLLEVPRKLRGTFEESRHSTHFAYTRSSSPCNLRHPTTSASPFPLFDYFVVIRNFCVD